MEQADDLLSIAGDKQLSNPWNARLVPRGASPDSGDSECGETFVPHGHDAH